MCKGNCGKCKKAEFETTDVQVESLGQRSGMIVDDSQELQPTCVRVEASKRSRCNEAIKLIEDDAELNLANKNLDCSWAILKTVEAMIAAGYRK